MAFETLVSIPEASGHAGDADWVFVDCRFTLGIPDAGRNAYLAAHIPGAVYADLERDLSGPIIPGVTGRHPLPSPEGFQQTLRRLGIRDGDQVVAYDQSTGALAAARLWWMLRWVGHHAAAVLDGGLDAWLAAGHPVSSGEEAREPSALVVVPQATLIASAGDVLAATNRKSAAVADARAASRYRGENESIDPVGGHIPGALSLPYELNLGPGNLFRSPVELRARLGPFAAHPEPPIMYCGSGVTAAHNALAYAHAGLGMARVYPGSWSEWITDERRPRATGEESA